MHFISLPFAQSGGVFVAPKPAEHGQATCNIMGSGSVYCLFAAPVSESGPIDLRFQSTSNGVQVQRSTNGGQSFEPGGWSSTGPDEALTALSSTPA